MSGSDFKEIRSVKAAGTLFSPLTLPKKATFAVHAADNDEKWRGLHTLSKLLLEFFDKLSRGWRAGMARQPLLNV